MGWQSMHVYNAIYPTCVRLGVNTFWLCAFVCFNVVKNQTLCECVRIFV